LPVRRPSLVYRRAILPFFLSLISLRQKPYRAATARRELPVATLALAGHYHEDGRRMNDFIDGIFRHWDRMHPFLKTLYILAFSALAAIFFWYQIQMARNQGKLKAQELIEGLKPKRNVLITPIGIVTYEYANGVSTDSVDEKILKLIKGHPNVDLRKYQDHIKAKILSVDRKGDSDDDIIPIGRRR
jgi:hypothetical protein